MPLAAKKRRGKGKEEKIEEEWIGGSEGKMVGKLWGGKGEKKEKEREELINRA